MTFRWLYGQLDRTYNAFQNAPIVFLLLIAQKVAFYYLKSYNNRKGECYGRYN